MKVIVYEEEWNVKTNNNTVAVDFSFREINSGVGHALLRGTITVVVRTMSRRLLREGEQWAPRRCDGASRRLTISDRVIEQVLVLVPVSVSFNSPWFVPVRKSFLSSRRMGRKFHTFKQNLHNLRTHVSTHYMCPMTPFPIVSHTCQFSDTFQPLSLPRIHLSLSFFFKTF